MAISTLYERQREIALAQYSDVVLSGQLFRLPDGEPLKLRLHLLDESFLDVHLSPTGRYSCHWERRLIGKSDSYRFDNAPHAAWRDVATFPAHFHDGQSNTVLASHLSADPIEAIQQVCQFIRQRLRVEHQ